MTQSKPFSWYLKLPRWTITLACLLAAVISYGLGFTSGMVCLIAIGAVLEVIYWMRIITAV